MLDICNDFLISVLSQHEVFIALVGISGLDHEHVDVILSLDVLTNLERNLKSCIKLALDFVSPENIHECIYLTKEFWVLPHNHKGKEDKLEVKKMILHALNYAVEELEKLTA
ncbi:hypothetical protein QQP08_025505 [Theobroma cacao]|nr:hypothetical protein QQP08_025505 [Theobroma cacao]